MIEITDDKGRVLCAFPIPDMGERQLSITQDGETLAGVEITAGGAVTIGHWPDGETWHSVLVFPSNRA